MSNHPTIQPREEAFSVVEQGKDFPTQQHSMLSAIGVAAFLIQNEILPSDEEGVLILQQSSLKKGTMR